MVCERKARLLLVSSQASPPSSMVSFHRATASLIDSTVSLLFSTTVLPSFATSWPPIDQRNGSHQPGASPKGWPAVWPIGRPLALSLRPTSRNLSQFSGKVSVPASASHDLRYATSPPPTVKGTPI